MKYFGGKWTLSLISLCTWMKVKAHRSLNLLNKQRHSSSVSVNSLVNQRRGKLQQALLVLWLMCLFVWWLCYKLTSPLLCLTAVGHTESQPTEALLTNEVKACSWCRVLAEWRTEFNSVGLSEVVGVCRSGQRLIVQRDDPTFGP